MKFTNMDLQLFADGASSSGGSAEGTAASGANDSAAVNQTGNSAAGQKAEEGNAHPEGNEGQSPESRAEAYAKWKAEYKDLYDTEVQGIVKSRLKGARENQAKLDAVTPVLELLSQRYHVDPNDLQSLETAIVEDELYVEKEANEKGLDVDQFKDMKKLHYTNERYRKIIESQQRQQEAAQRYQGWVSESEELKKKYPDFNLEKELQNEQFRSLIQTPSIDVKTAYEVAHHDELFASFGQKVAQQAQKRTVDSIKANGIRPTENGTGNQAAATVKNNVENMTKEQRDDICRRVLRGERIIL